MSESDFDVQLGIGVLGKFAMGAVAFLGSILLARVLGPGEYGAFYLLMAITKFLDNPVTGWANAARKRLAERDFPGDEAVGSVLIVWVVGSLVFAVGAVLARPLLEARLDVTNPHHLLVVLFVAVSGMSLVIEVLKATDRFGSATWFQTGRDVLRVGSQVALVLAGFGVAGMVGGIAVANLLVVPAVIRHIGEVPTLPTRRSLGEIWAFAKSSIPATFFGTALGRMDVLIIGFLATNEAVGLYEISFKLSLPAMFITGVAGGGLMGRVSNRDSRDVSFVEDVEKNVGVTSLLAVPMVFGAAVLAEPLIVTVYSSKFAGGGAFLVGITVYRLFLSQRAIYGAVVNGMDYPSVHMKLNVVEFVINLVGGVALLLAIGPIGVVFASIATAFFGYVARVVFVRRHLEGLTVLPTNLLHQLLAGAIMSLVVFGFTRIAPIGHWQWVVAAVGLGGVTYFGVLAAISPAFSARILAVIRSILGR
jgi:O-antigen/teichoic acid export membrane protein